MKLKVLEVALEQLKLHVDDGYYDDDAQLTTENLQQAIDEVQEMKRQLEQADKETRKVWQDDVTILHSSIVCPIQNNLWYDVYGRMARQHNNYCSFEQYATAVRNYEDICGDFLTDSFLADGYSLINDLWQDNEREEANRADGSYNTSYDELFMTNN